MHVRVLCMGLTASLLGDDVPVLWLCCPLLAAPRQGLKGSEKTENTQTRTLPYLLLPSYLSQSGWGVRKGTSCVLFLYLYPKQDILLRQELPNSFSEFIFGNVNQFKLTLTTRRQEKHRQRNLYCILHLFTKLIYMNPVSSPDLISSLGDCGMMIRVSSSQWWVPLRSKVHNKKLNRLNVCVWVVGLCQLISAFHLNEDMLTASFPRPHFSSPSWRGSEGWPDWSHLAGRRKRNGLLLWSPVKQTKTQVNRGSLLLRDKKVLWLLFWKRKSLISSPCPSFWKAAVDTFFILF